MLILDDIRSVYNVGSILRTASAFGVERVVCCGITPHPRQENDTRLPHVIERVEKQLAKTALHAQEHLEIEYAHNVSAAIRDAKNRGCRVLALEQAPQSTLLQDVKWPKRFALVLGNEPNGIQPETLTMCDQTVEISMYGKKQSLNVAVACGAALGVWRLR